MESGWDGLEMPKRLWALMAVLMTVSLAVMDGIIVNVALPTISTELGISSSDSIWIINSYQISIIVSLLLFSALGDVIGYRKVYLSGIILFSLASVGCALSWSFHSLVLFRVVQGVGASALSSVNTSLVRLIFPRKKLGIALAINSTVVSVSAVVGPTLSGAILAFASWPMLFLVNIPFSIIAVSLGWFNLPHNPNLDSTKVLNRREALMNLLFFGLLFAVVTGLSHSMEWWIIAIEVVLLALVGTIYIRSQLVSQTPILPFDLLKIPIFSISIITSILSFIAQMSAMVAIPFFLHDELGYHAVEIGLVMTAWPVMNIVSALTAGMLVTRYHAGILGGIGLALFASGLALAALSPADPEPWDLMWRLALCGLGYGLFQSPNNSVIMSSAPLARSGSASGMMATARLIGQITGAALVALLLKLLPEPSMVMLFSGGVALVAMIISFSRISLPLPELLHQRK